MSNEEQSVNFDDAQNINFEATNENFDFGAQSNSNEDNGPMNPPKRFRRNDDDEIRFLIPSKVAGGVIGKGGQNIQKLRSENKAQVNVGDSQGPERVVTIVSDLDTCSNVLREMLKHFDKANGECELRLLIHQSLAGCIIGKQGAKIKELKEKLQCKLKVFSNTAPQSTDRVVQIIGKEELCITSFLEIIELIKQTPIKGPIHNYDPHNFDDMYADEYGGYGMGSGTGNFRSAGNGNSGGRGGAGGGGNRNFGNKSRFDDRGNSAGRPNQRNNNDRGRQSDFVDPWAQDDMQMGANSSFGNNGNLFGMSGSFNSGNSNGSFGNQRGGGNADNEEKSSTQVTIPKDMAGAVIGKGGGRIRRIRTESNAFIQIDEALPGSTDRIITITGTPKQIQTAQYMLQQSIRDGAK